MASPLDSPRFFDDAAHSEWHLGGRVATGPRDVFRDAKALAHVGPAAPQLRRHSRNPGAPKPDDVEHPASPRSYDSATDSDDAIAIEIVRGAKGPHDNTWSVVVDGLRYPVPARAQNAPNAPFTFKLPGGVAHEELTPTTRVRPVLVAVRLEAEARVPMRVEVAIDQVLATSELAVQRRPGADEYPVQLGAPHILAPYRVGDIAAASLLLPYPFWAPAQSALGILSFEPVLRYQEQKAYAIFYNAFVTRQNFVNAQSYSLEGQIHEIVKTMSERDREWTNAARKALRDLAPAFGVNLQGMDSSAETKKLKDLRKDYLGLGTPQRPAVLQSKFAPQEPQKGTTDTIVIGGGKVSAARELADMFRQLSVACEKRVSEAEADTSGKKLPLRQHLQRIRIALDLQGDHKLRALFDALFTTEPYPPTKDFLERKRVEGDRYWAKQYTVDVDKEASLYGNDSGSYEYEVTDWGDFTVANVFAHHESQSSLANVHVPAQSPVATPSTIGAPASPGEGSRHEVTFNPLKPVETMDTAERDNLEKSIGSDASKRMTNELKRVRDKGKEQYMFTYERLAIEARSKTTMRAQIRVSVYDYDGSVQEFVFDSEREDGIIAHAVYEQLPLDIAALDYYARDFVDCMFRAHRQASNKFFSALDFVEDYVRPWIFSKYSRGENKANRALQLQEKDMIGIYKFAVGWVAAPGKTSADGKTSTERSPFPFDEKRLEDRVAELRLMIREILPPWPPPNRVSPHERRPVASDLSTASAAAYDTAPAVTAVLGLDAPTVKLNTLFSPEQVKKYNLTDEAAEAEKMALFDNDLKERIKSYRSAKTDTSIVVFTKEALDDRATRVLERRLPLVVKPDTMGILFQMLANMDPPTEDIPSDAETRRFGFVPVLAGSAFAGVAFYWGAPLWLAFATMDATINVTKNKVNDRTQRLDTLSISQRLLSLETVISLFQGGVAIAARAGGGPLGAAASNAALTSAIGQLAGTTVPAVLTLARTFGIAASPESTASMAYAQGLQNDLLPLTVNLASTIHAFFTYRMDKRYLNKEWYLRHRAVMRDKPVAAAINAANAAIKGYRSRGKREAALFDSEYREGAVYSRATGKRFLFVEYYAVDQQTSSAFDGLLQLSNEATRPWAPVPNGSAMRLMPPPEIGEALYIAEELRGMPLTKIVEFTAGVAPSLAATTPAALAAKAATRELAEAVARQRRLLRGEHLMQPAGALVMQLAATVASILRAVYGKNAGFTAVFGEDILWSCARGGVAARLAVRHFGLFDAAEAASADDLNASARWRERDAVLVASANVPGAPPQRRPAKSALQAPVFWNQPRRNMMEQFVVALLAEAADVARLMKGVAFPGPPIKTVASEAVQRFARVGALLQAREDLSQDERGRLLMVPASATAHTLLSSVAPNKTLDSLIGAFDLRLDSVLQFAEQSTIDVPPPPPYSNAQTKAAWASKRIATSMSREQIVGDGAEGITKLLSGLSGLSGATEDSDVELHLGAGPTVYYCPLGSRVVALPGRVPFDIDLFEKRLVWMDALRAAAARTANAVVESSADPAWTTPVDAGALIETAPARLVKQDIQPVDLVTGSARHPLAISVDSNTIRVTIADTKADATSRAAGATKERSVASDLDLVHALGRFHSNTFDPADVATRSALARRVAFAAERLLFALSLASTMPGASLRLVIRVATAFDAVSCSIATAILATDLGVIFPNVTIEVEEGAPFARVMLKQLERQAKSALSIGCKVCSIAEVAVAV